MGDLTSSLMKNLDLSFKVNLPNKALNHNAKEITNDGKELMWNLSSNSVDSITFSFSLYNTVNIVICTIVLIIIIAFIAFIIVRKIKNKDLKNANNISKED